MNHKLYIPQKKERVNKMDWRHIGEPSLEPPEEKSYMADCGCEVYEGDEVFEWEESYICEDCFRTHIRLMPTKKIADYMGIDHGLVRDGIMGNG